MASPTITLSDQAPAEAVHFVFGSVEFDLGGSGRKTYDTDDEATISNALAHPWLDVKFPAVKVVTGSFHEQLDPADDALTARGRPVDPNDPNEAAKAEQAKEDASGVTLALDAGQEQSVPLVTDSEAAVTLAAVPDTKTAAKADADPVVVDPAAPPVQHDDVAKTSSNNKDKS